MKLNTNHKTKQNRGLVVTQITHTAKMLFGIICYKYWMVVPLKYSANRFHLFVLSWAGYYAHSEWAKPNSGEGK